MSSSFKGVALLINYQKLNRHSFNALVGVIETQESLDELPIYFARNTDELKTQTQKLVKRFGKVIVAFSLMTCQILEVERIISILKKIGRSKVVLIAGGPHSTGDPLGTLKMGFDIVVRGEGEKAFPNIIKKILSNDDYSLLRGIAFSHNGQYVLNHPSKKIDINHYPPFAIKHNKFGPIEISRGCPWTCRYCQTPFLFGTKVRHRSVSNVCKWIKTMKKISPLDIRFVSPNAFMYGSKDGKSVNVDKIEELLKSVRQILGNEGRIFFGTFPSEVRPESVTRETVELVTKYCDNDNLVIGAQSGSDRILEHICRGHGVNEVRQAVKLTIDAGLKANVDFIFGLPYEKEEDTLLTLNLAKELTSIGARIHAHTFMPLPGTPFQNMPPGKIVLKIKREMEKLISEGKLYGQWHTQEKIAGRSQREYV
jgi:B12-binding domain/radical SAM domain protein